MFLHTQPAPFSAGDGLDDFRVVSPAEVLALLRRLSEDSVLLNISTAEGAHYTTTLWTVDAAQRKIGFSADADHPQLQNLLDADEAVVVGYLDSVKLQFGIHHLLLVRGRGSCVLQAALPPDLFRFQRRSSFRVRALERSAPIAHVVHPTAPGMELSLRVLDVSVGGCALTMPQGMPALPVGVRIKGVTIELDADTRFEATLQVQHVTCLPPVSMRLGCALHDLSGDAQRALQRYIDQTQKRRRLLSPD